MINIFTRHTFVFYYGLLLWGMLLLDWSSLSIPVAILLFLLASFFTDLLSGIWHLCIDFYPLNYKKGFDKLFYFKASRGSQEFADLKKHAFSQGTFLEKLAYRFKMHHRKPSLMHKNTYNSMFLDNSAFALFALIAAFLLITLDASSISALALLYCSFFFANIEYIHACVHRTPQFPTGVKFISVLQSLKLVYSYETHKAHHQAKGTGFCFITGHSNFIVNWACRLLLKYHIVTMEEWKGRQRPDKYPPSLFHNK